MALIQLLASVTATLAGKVAAAATVAAVAGGGVTVAANVTDDGEEAAVEEEAVEQIEQTDEQTEGLSVDMNETTSEGKELEGEETEGEDIKVASDEGDPDAEDDRGRSSAVHEALAGEDSDARPGDGDGSAFGQAVSKNAQENPGFGQSVAAAARGDNDGDGDGTSAADEGKDEGDDDHEDDGDDDGESSSVDSNDRGNSANAPGRQARD